MTRIAGVDLDGCIYLGWYADLGFVPGATVEIAKTITGSLIVMMREPSTFDGRVLDASTALEPHADRLALDDGSASRGRATDRPTQRRVPRRRQ